MAESYWTDITKRQLSRRRAIAATAAGAAGAALLAACGGGSSSSGGGATKEASSLVVQPVDTLAKAKRGGVLKDRAFGDPPTLDVALPNNPWNSPGFHVYSALFWFKPGFMKPTEHEIMGDLAESWETSPDGLTISVKIRPNVKWHNKAPVNGRTLDADDLNFAWKRFEAKNSGRTSLANSVDPAAPVLSFNAIDARTLQIKLKEPLVYALGLFCPGTSGGLIMVPKETDSTFDPRGDMIGTGPWSLADYKQSVGFTLKRNPDYWDKDWALVDTVELPIITEYATALAQLKTGGIYEFGQSGAPVVKPEDVLPLKQEEPRINIFQGDYALGGLIGSRFNFGWLPAGKSNFQDERVRQAISMSWDRDLYLDSLLNVTKFKSQGVPVDTRWNSSLNGILEGWWLDPKGKDFGPNAKYFQYNLKEAKALLSAAGFPNGFDTTSNVVPTSELGTTVNHAQVIDGFIKELGINSKVRPLDYAKEYGPNFRDGHGQWEGWSYVSTAGGVTGGSAIGNIAVEYWSKGGAAFKGFSLNGSNDQSGDPTLDGMIAKARVEQDTERLRQQVFELQRYLAKPMYSIAMPGYATGLTPAWPALQNFRVWSQGADTARNSYRWWIDDTKPPFKSA